MMTAPLSFGRIVVIGGGCYGSWYVQQLSRAFAKGALRCERVVVVDRNEHPPARRRAALGEFGALPLEFEQTGWHEYLERWLAVPEESLLHDALVPSPLMPHLLLDWLVARAAQRWPERSVSVRPLRSLAGDVPGVPWQREAPDGRHYVSFAEWMCPVNCIEPAKCPATRGARDWSLPVTLSHFVANGTGGATAEPDATIGARDRSSPLHGPVIFHCLHRTWGVGMIDAAPVVAASAQIARWGDRGPVDVLIGTTSHCHGALGVLSIA